MKKDIPPIIGADEAEPVRVDHSFNSTLHAKPLNSDHLFTTCIRDN